jgi:dolichyl-phosphate beta-glucosyltransferase
MLESERAVASEKTFLSVVIPAYNEERRIGRTLTELIRYLKGKDFASEIIVVDDGCTDGTRDVVAGFGDERLPVSLVGYGRNMGKGYAIKTGMLKAGGEYVLFTDADLSTPVEMFDRFLPFIREGWEVILGTRKTDGAQIDKHQPKYRENMGKVFTWLSNAILGLHVTDFTCGFKCFHQRTIQPVFGSQRICGWSYDTEIVFIASSKGFRIREVPVRWFNDEATRVRLLRNVFTCLAELFQIWNNNRKGFYR